MTLINHNLISYFCYLLIDINGRVLRKNLNTDNFFFLWLFVRLAKKLALNMFPSTIRISGMCTISLMIVTSISHMLT